MYGGWEKDHPLARNLEDAALNRSPFNLKDGLLFCLNQAKMQAHLSRAGSGSIPGPSGGPTK